MLIICPPDAKINWEEMIATYGIKAIIITYSTLAGKSGILSHPYLIQYGDKEYRATSELTELIKQKVLVVFDESQVAKNTKALACKACHAISKEVIRMNNGSRIMALSATPVDKEIYVESICKLTGIITADSLSYYNKSHKTNELQGYNEIYNFCYKLNPMKAKELYPKTLRAAAIKDSTFQLFVQILKARIAFTMPKPIINAKLNCKTMFYKMDTGDLNNLNRDCKN